MDMVIALVSLRHDGLRQLLLPCIAHATGTVDKCLFAPVTQITVPENGILALAVNHSEYAEIDSEPVKGGTVHGVLIRDFDNVSSEFIFFAVFLYHGVDDTVLENRNLVFVAKDPKMSESLERRQS
jgi:hypothetical protein